MNAVSDACVVELIPSLAQDIKALFARDRCPEMLSCEFAHNDSWYIAFDSEADAQQVSRCKVICERADYIKYPREQMYNFNSRRTS